MFIKIGLCIAGGLLLSLSASPVTAQTVTQPDGSTVIEPVLGPRNTDRFSTYARLDFKARRTFALSRGRLSLTLDVVNLTDRDNTCCVDRFLFDPQPDGSVDVRRDLDNWLGFTTSFTALWVF